MLRFINCLIGVGEAGKENIDKTFKYLSVKITDIIYTMQMC